MHYDMRNYLVRILLLILIFVTLPGWTSFAQQAPKFKILTQQFIYDTAPFPSCHASTIAETPRGLIAAWFGGTHEKHDDVEIWISRKEKSNWTTPISIANGVQDASKRYPC